MSKANFFQIMPCKHCGYIGYHLWAGSGLCPGLTVEDQDMPESMFYYQMGFKQGYNQATSDITTKDAESHPRPASEVEVITRYEKGGRTEYSVDGGQVWLTDLEAKPSKSICDGSCGWVCDQCCNRSSKSKVQETHVAKSCERCWGTGQLLKEQVESICPDCSGTGSQE